jgi:hypothetical protein
MSWHHNEVFFNCCKQSFTESQYESHMKALVDLQKEQQLILQAETARDTPEFAMMRVLMKDHVREHGILVEISTQWKKSVLERRRN